MHSTRLPLLAAASALAFATSAAPAADVPTAFIARAAQYQQTSTAAPKLATTLPYLFIAECDNFDAGDFEVMSVGLPTTGVFEQEARNNGDSSTDEFNFKGQYQNLTSFNTAFPTGTYTLSLVPSGGDTVKLTLNIKKLDFPNVPTVSNYADAQKIDATKAFTVKWGAFSGAATNDRILFGVSADDDEGYEFISTGSPAGPVSTATGLLAGKTTSYTIPAKSLPPGKNFVAELIFVRADVQATYGNGKGYYASGAGTVTRVKLHTAGTADTTKPTVTKSAPASGATGVATNATVTITFSEPMRTKWGWSISYNNIGSASPTVTWTNATTLTIAAPSGGWPKGKKVDIVLNPANYTPYIKDLAGNALASKTISFTVKS